MTLRDALISVSDTYGEAMKIGRQRVSTIVLQRGATLQRLADGEADVTTGTFERAMLWFSDNWPTGLAWPDDVPRPVPERAKEAAE